MLTLKKLWNILNHAGKPWQISLAVSLAMIVGFTPTVSVHNLVILVFVLVLNIHLGMFLIATAFFASLGYIFDPLFHQVGLTLLSHESLLSLWTTLYNSSSLQLTNFNNTVLLGSLVVSLVLFFPLLKIVSGLLVKYRELFAQKVKNIPILNKFEYFKGEDLKSVKPIRLFGLILFAGIIGTVGIFKILFLDDIIKSNIEKQVAKNSEKELKIGTFETSILSSSVVLETLELNDKKESDNNIMVSRIDIDISFSELLMKKLVVENLILSNISFPNIKTEQDKSKSAQTTSEKKRKESQSLQDKFDISSLGKVDVSNIEESIDKNIKSKVDKYKEYYEKIKPYLNSDTTEDDLEPVRGKGTWIRFKDDSNIPKILIKEAKFYILYKGENYTGNFYDFTNNQNLYNKPLLIEINGKTKKVKMIDATISIFETDTKKEDKVTVKFDQLKVDDYSKKSVSFSNTLLNGNLNFTIETGNKLVGKSYLDVSRTDIAFNEANKYIKKLNESLIQTKGIKATLDIKGTLEKPKLKIKSNLDKILSTKVKTVIQSQKEQIKNELKSKAKKMIKKQEEKLKAKIEEKVNDEVKTQVKDKLKSMFGF